MRCFDCKLSLKTISYDGRNFWKCGKCNGAFVPVSFLEKFTEAKDVLGYLKVGNREDLSKRTCPVCMTVMRVALSGGGSTELDICRPCAAVWFDGGEIDLKSGAKPRFGNAPDTSGLKAPLPGLSENTRPRPPDEYEVETLVAMVAGMGALAAGLLKRKIS